ncbi:hypothetical protein ACFSDD_07175 [Salipiger marinus]|uniref:Tetratricopeptide repeat-like domain-containing protein n=1 Tax=Salipiger marinus TaxID=555512 RepID=A0A1G8RSG2_9RHOB|nr:MULTISPECIES: hypothetical protein [Salipiger]MCD1620351.1 hypothetical protein [Salipiger manganoxidans]MEB3420996.1 hypothetical protein [Salipiger manganoxidans]SDJ19859.1 hypothetical protein SAMN04487993_102166 [Salipiger marinus]
MSNSDSFIDEVTEEVRRDRLFTAMRRYGWIGVVAVVALVGGAAWREYDAAQDRARAQDFGSALSTALAAEAPAARAEAVQQVTAPDAAAAALRDLLAAAELSGAGDEAAAAALLEQTAANGDLAEIYRDIAAFKAVSGAGDALTPEDRRLRLEAMAVPGKPLRLLAEEQLALLDIEAGETEAAISRLQAIQNDAETTAGLRQRASQLIVALGGTPETAG